MTPQLQNMDGSPLSWAELHARNGAWHAAREREQVVPHERVRAEVRVPREPFMPDKTPVGPSTRLYPVTWSAEELAEWEAKAREGTLFSAVGVQHQRQPGAVASVIEHGTVRSYVAECRCDECTLAAQPYLEMLGMK